MSPSGASRVEATLDRDGRIIQVRYLDATDQARPDRNGAYGWTWQYDAKGRLFLFTRVGQDRRPATLADGCLSLQREYNNDGELTSTSWLTAEAKPNPRHGSPNRKFSSCLEKDGTVTVLTRCGTPQGERQAASASAGSADTQDVYERAAGEVAPSHICGQPRNHAAVGNGWVRHGRYDYSKGKELPRKRYLDASVS